MSPIIFDTQRLVLATIAVAIYVLMCAIIARKQIARRHFRSPRRGTEQLSDAAQTASWQIVYASQTGTAEELAQQTANTLHLAGISMQLRSLAELDADTLAETERALFIVSTYGEGNPPDNAALFAQRTMSATPALGRLHYALLALGDRSYTHFCGFGRELDQWLQAQGAQALFPALEVHQCDAASIETWRQQLSHLAGTDDAPDWQGPAYDDWRLLERKLLNPGSQGNSVFHLEFAPAADRAPPAWESGDLVQIIVPTDSARPREYSIASIPADGRVHLLVRLHRHPDGTFGAASDWLTQQMQVGDSVSLRLRQHERFRLGGNASRPLILIGNGSGIAGLRSHLKARISRETGRNWLLFGERNAQHDYYYRDEIADWHQRGMLTRLDAVFSRDQTERRYVQHRLPEVAEELRAWIAQGAAIYICGSLNGMASGVDDALASILGRQALDDLSQTGRYRRDVY